MEQMSRAEFEMIEIEKARGTLREANKQYQASLAVTEYLRQQVEDAWAALDALLI